MKKAIVFFSAAALLAVAIVLAVLQQRASQHRAQVNVEPIPEIKEPPRPIAKPSPVVPAAPEVKTAPAPERIVVEEPPALPTPPAAPAIVTPPPADAPKPAKPAKAPKDPMAKFAKQAADSANAVVPLPLAREALGYVGMDPKADAVWFTAINDPEMSPKARQDLIEDLNEDGFADPKHPTPDELPLIESRIQMIEEIGPYAMDKVNYDAFQEAYKDLVEMYLKMQK